MKYQNIQNEHRYMWILNISVPSEIYPEETPSIPRVGEDISLHRPAQGGPVYSDHSP